MLSFANSSASWARPAKGTVRGLIFSSGEPGTCMGSARGPMRLGCVAEARKLLESLVGTSKGGSMSVECLGRHLILLILR